MSRTGEPASLGNIMSRRALIGLLVVGGLTADRMVLPTPATAADGIDAYDAPAVLDMPWGAPVSAVSPEMVVSYVATFTRPSSRVIVVGEDRPVDKLPAAGTVCTCDAPDLRCAVTTSGVRVGWEGTAAEWPVAEGELGRCVAGHATFPVSVRLSKATDAPWWRGRRTLVVPTPATRSASLRRTVAPLRSLPDTVEGHTDPTGVSCRLQDGEVLVDVAPAAPMGEHPCLSWEDGGVAVQLVAPIDRRRASR